jgi:3-oxoacyl-[acyl-carrier-protein] synthase III
MSRTRIEHFKVAGVSTCVPPRVFDNMERAKDFGETEVRKVVAMAGVRCRHVVEPGVTSTDLSFEAAASLLDGLGWERESISALIMVTQSPDYFLPSSSCLAHKWLGLGSDCASFDVGLGCSSYPYGLYLAATMLQAGGQRRVLLLNGETPSQFTDPADHATTLLFGDAGSATAIEWDERAAPAFFSLHTDGAGYDGLIVRGGGYRDRNPANPRDNFLRMEGAAVFNFTIKRVPALIRETLEFAGLGTQDIETFLFHQSNQFMMKHLIKKAELPIERVPFILDRFGNCGGPSVPLALTQGQPGAPTPLGRVMALGYGVGLSWGSAVFNLAPGAPLLHSVYSGEVLRS